MRSPRRSGLMPRPRSSSIWSRLASSIRRRSSVRLCRTPPQLPACSSPRKPWWPSCRRRKPLQPCRAAAWVAAWEAWTSKSCSYHLNGRAPDHSGAFPFVPCVLKLAIAQVTIGRISPLHCAGCKTKLLTVPLWNSRVDPGPAKALRREAGRTLLRPTLPGAIVASAIGEREHAGSSRVGALGRLDPTEDSGRNVPLLPRVGVHRHGLLVVARQHALKPTLAGRLAGDTVPNLELQHLHMSAHLVEKTQARDDAVVEIDEFGLGQLVNIDRHRGAIP